MLENTYEFSTADVTTVERIVSADGVRINHLSLAQGQSVDPHQTADSAHMIITKGVLGLTLDDQEQHSYPAGSIVGIPAGTMLGIANIGEGTMHLFVIKTT